MRRRGAVEAAASAFPRGEGQRVCHRPARGSWPTAGHPSHRILAGGLHYADCRFHVDRTPHS